MNAQEDKITFYGCFIWGLAILFFFYEFFLRIFLGTIATEVIAELSLSVRQFSLIGASYYLIYGVMQIGVGLFTEKIGARIALSVATAICALGAFVFTFATGFPLAFIGRLLIGFGSSFAFVGMLVLSLNWFPKRHFGLIVGVAMLLGALGPIMAGGPLAYLNQLLNGNWRLILVVFGVLGVVLAVTLALFVRNKPAQKEQQVIFITPQEKLRSRIFELLKYRQVWYMLLFSGCVYLAMPFLAAYWGTTFLQSRGLDKTRAAFIISTIWFGFAIGSPVIGKLSDLCKRRKYFLFYLPLLGFFMSSLILYAPLKSELVLVILFFLVGLASSSASLSYTVVVELVPTKLHSAALGMNNAAAMLFAATFPALAGTIIQAAQRKIGGEGLSQVALTQGLTLIPVFYMIGFLVALIGIRETFCRQQHEVHAVEIS